MTANITVPTKVSELTNDSGFLTSHQSLSNYSTLANTIKSLSISGKTITYTKGDDTTGTLTTQDNNTWTAMVGATSSSNGSVGYVNAIPPKDGYNTKYLRADGTWQVPPDHTYTVNNATLTIQKNGTTVNTFTSNASSNVTCNITVPTKTSDLTNDSGFLTSHQDLSGYIPLSGTNALNGNIVPDTDVTYNLGSSTKQFYSVYTSNVVNNNTTSELSLGNTVGGADMSLCPKDYNAGLFRIQAFDGTSRQSLIGHADGRITWGSKNVAMQEDVVPRSVGAVLSGTDFARTDATKQLALCGGFDSNSGGNIILYGNAYSSSDHRGAIALYALTGVSTFKVMFLHPSGTWTWDGTACQITSDQRYKQQIAKIDDKLLDAWEDVNLVQFKYNDAVNEKGDNARLHTGYVVQQIDEACKSHNVDISAYGLYCHEEYPERTEEVEVTQDDGTIKKETKVVEPAKEHYSLRYTETLVVECAYLRRENDKLKQQIQQILETLDVHSKILNSIN